MRFSCHGWIDCDRSSNSILATRVSSSQRVSNDRHSGPRPFSALVVVGSTSFAFSRIGKHAAERRNRMHSPLWESAADRAETRAFFS